MTEPTLERTDTAHFAWDEVWKADDGSEEWGGPEPRVLAEATRLRLGGAKVALDLGSGVGRNALALSALGFETTALDLAPTGLARTRQFAAKCGLSVRTVRGGMTDLPFDDASFDYVVAWNVIYHGAPEIVRRAISEVARVLKPGGAFQGTMLSKRRDDFGLGREIAPSTFVRPEAGGDKAHPHFFSSAAETVALFEAFEPRLLEDFEPYGSGSWHWHVIADRPEL